jgi:hypothetical protein
MIGTLHRRLDSKDCLLSEDLRNPLVVSLLRRVSLVRPKSGVGDEFLHGAFRQRRTAGRPECAIPNRHLISAFDEEAHASAVDGLSGETN